MKQREVKVESATQRAAGLKAIHKTCGIDSKIIGVDVEHRGKAKYSSGKIKRLYYFPEVNGNIYALYSDGEAYRSESPEDVGRVIDEAAMPDGKAKQYDDDFLEDNKIVEVELHNYYVRVNWKETQDD
jgi:hypothetical protein